MTSFLMFAVAPPATWGKVMSQYRLNAAKSVFGTGDDLVSNSAHEASTTKVSVPLENELGAGHMYGFEVSARVTEKNREQMKSAFIMIA